MFGTPDFGHTDLWHFNFALKFFLHQALTSGYLPFWSKNIGTGFPVAGEGQIGAGNIFNFLFFKFLDPVWAFNLSLLVIFLTVFSGAFLFARAIKLSKLASFYLAASFTFCGVFVTHIVHFNLIQTASFFPWLLFLAEKYFQTGKKRFLVFLALILSQQIYSGFQQMVMISLFGVALYSLLRKRPFVLILPVVAGAILALPQLLLSAQMVGQSFRTGGVALAEMVKYPFPPVHLLTFFWPYLLGDPRIGTYPIFGENWGIFWESTGYAGFLAVPLAIFYFLRRRPKKFSLIFLILAAVSLVLLLGKYTPFFFVFQIPPLSMFRVPARFLLLFSFSLTVLAAFGLDLVKSRRLKIFLLAVALVDLGYFAGTYNAVINPQKWLEKPAAVQFLEADPVWFRISSFYAYTSWNHIYTPSGWKNMADYWPLRNSLDPNQNLFWGVSQADVYAGLVTRRLEIWRSLLNSGITIKPSQNRIDVASSSAKLLALSGVKYVISPFPLADFKIVATPSASPQVLISQTPQFLPHAYLTANYIVARDIPDLLAKVASPSSATVLEENISLATQSGEVGTAVVTKNEDLEVKIEINATASALLILSDSYYPAWQAFLDGQRTVILPANLNQRAVIVPPGEHQVDFYYRPFSFDNLLSWFHP